MEFDFSGYATKNGVKCADGRTINKDAFLENDGGRVPLVWQHQHNDPDNVLGYADLENRPDGVYAYAKFNKSPAAIQARELVEHGDVNSLSIYANQLKHQGRNVTHGMIREVSLVLSGANPGAMIDSVYIKHDGFVEELPEDEGIITSGETLEHKQPETNDNEAKEMPNESGSETKDRTVGDVFNSLTEEQKNVVYYLIGKAVEEEGGGQSDTAEHSDMDGDNFMPRNVFDQSTPSVAEETLSHSQIESIFAGAQELGSLSESALVHAETYGIKDIDTLFPDAKELNNRPEFISRRMEWVSKVLGNTKHSPFSRIKTTQADITADEARARGYVKGNLKKEEVFSLLQRTTTPTTIYKKQKLDRDDIIDITSFDVVAWIKAEMRVMLDEEIARAILIGDGRDVEKSDGEPNEDKINEANLRPIWTDDDLYAHKLRLENGPVSEAMIDAFLRARVNYKGSGTPTLFTTTGMVVEFMLLRDKMGRKLYETKASLAAALGVSEIVEVEVMDNATRVDDEGTELSLIGIIVNLQDYTVGADRGGQISMFDDFDIDYNQYKYLLETRISGALTKIKSAVVVEMPTAVAEPTP